jgi:RND family efflux transporter MFP subunit
VQIGGEILRIMDVGRIRAAIRIPVSARPRTRVGAEVSLQVESMPEVRWTGTVTRISPSADERTRTFDAYVEVDNRRQTVPLSPGYFVKAEVQGPVLADALIVPRNAIVEGSVFVVKDSRAVARRVYVERYLADRAVINGDVQPGELVILTNLDLLYDDAPVRLNQDAPTADRPGVLSGGS